MLKNQAGIGLLHSYSLERQPIGAGIIKRANDGYRDNQKAWKGLGLGDQSASGLQKTIEALAELKAATPAGVKRRALWRELVLLSYAFSFDKYDSPDFTADSRPVRGNTAVLE